MIENGDVIPTIDDKSWQPLLTEGLIKKRLQEFFERDVAGPGKHQAGRPLLEKELL
jgi:hypothetical protein